jgi:diguanylate cyclase (GGDEF)-like protein
MDIQERLLHTEIFASLDDAGLDLVVGSSRVTEIPSGGMLFSEGDKGGILFLMLSGRLQIEKNGADGNLSVIAELVEGDLLGELEFFTAAPFNASARAMEDSKLLRIPGEGDSFSLVLEKDPQVAATVLYEFLKVFSARLRKANSLVKENSALVQELKRQVYGDKLTGLYNKTFLEETLPTLVKTKEPLGLLLMKPDNFKMINDTFGHEAGDETLRIMAAALNRFVADRGVVLRYMGNELGVILAGRDRAGTLAEAQSIMKMFNTLDISDATKSKDVFLSMSIGAAVYPDHSLMADELILMAHELPLLGRERGGNVILFPEDGKPK